MLRESKVQLYDTLYGTNTTVVHLNREIRIDQTNERTSVTSLKLKRTTCGQIRAGVNANAAGQPVGWRLGKVPRL